MEVHTVLFIGGMGGGEIMIILLFLLLPILAWVVALVDIIRSQFRSDTDRLLWIVVVTLAPVLSVLIYLVLGRRYKVEEG
ncbi:MAG: PLD nuclease N-terminal domain-containing protein [Tunicatimonas sp.]